MRICPFPVSTHYGNTVSAVERNHVAGARIFASHHDVVRPFNTDAIAAVAQHPLAVCIGADEIALDLVVLRREFTESDHDPIVDVARDHVACSRIEAANQDVLALPYFDPGAVPDRQRPCCIRPNQVSLDQVRVHPVLLCGFVRRFLLSPIPVPSPYDDPDNQVTGDQVPCTRRGSANFHICAIIEHDAVVVWQRNVPVASVPIKLPRIRVPCPPS